MASFKTYVIITISIASQLLKKNAPPFTLTENTEMMLWIKREREKKKVWFDVKYEKNPMEFEQKIGLETLA